jgi:hypothetical protein
MAGAGQVHVRVAAMVNQSARQRSFGQRRRHERLVAFFLDVEPLVERPAVEHGHLELADRDAGLGRGVVELLAREAGVSELLGERFSQLLAAAIRAARDTNQLHRTPSSDAIATPVVGEE